MEYENRLTRAVREAVEANDKEAAQEALKKANRNLHSYVSKGIVKEEYCS